MIAKEPGQNGVNEYGVIIPYSQWREVAKVLMKQKRTKDIEKPSDDYEAQYLAEIKILMDGDTFEGIGGFCGTCYPIAEDGTDIITRKEAYDDETVIFARLNNQPSLCSKAYSSLTEAVNELTKRLAGKLPTGFDLYGNMRHIVGKYRY